MSLVVADMDASLSFYAKLGFQPIGGDGESWAILKNEDTVIGLFCGMFERNILTFNPGWDGPGQSTATFTDIRRLRDSLATDGIETAADTTSDAPDGPASFIITDPDGNQILIDQHV